MADAKQCDRCGKLVRPGENGARPKVYTGTLNFVDQTGQAERLHLRADLCPSCVTEMLGPLVRLIAERPAVEEEWTPPVVRDEREAAWAELTEPLAIEK